MENVKELLNNQKSYFYTGETKDIDFRIEKLKTLKRAILKLWKWYMQYIKKGLI